MSPISATFTDKFLEKIGKVDRQRVERFLEDVVRERNFFESIFEELSEGIVVTDAEGRVILINREARGMLGLRGGAKVLGQPLIDLVRDEGLLQVLLGSAATRLDHWEVEIEHPARRDLLLTLLLMRDSDTGEVKARVLILADVTEHRRREREQARAERLASLAVLTAGVAHEIKNPLNSLRIHGQLLQQSLADAHWPSEIQAERSRRSAGIILEEIQRLARIVEQFMQAVRPVAPNLTQHNLNVILRRVLEALAPQQHDPELHLELDLDPQLPDVWVDDQQMAQVFVNLIRNALESFDKPVRLLRISSRTVDSTAEVTVADNGGGIASENLERIYQPYFTTKFGGTGLGLMVVHRIVGEHGGRIVIKSREHEGTEVTVQLPLAKRPPRLLEQQEAER
jgi:two-component system, sporulation sensor kinase E